MPDPDQAPVSCRLSASEFQSRERQWRAVVDAGLVSRARVPGGARLTFGPDRSLVHDLVELVDAERACCSWASWTLTSTDVGTTVEVTADGDRAATLWRLFEVES